MIRERNVPSDQMLVGTAWYAKKPVTTCLNQCPLFGDRVMPLPFAWFPDLKKCESRCCCARWATLDGRSSNRLGLRVEQVFEIIKQPARGKTCDAINGIVDESKEVMKEFKGSAALDAGL